MRTRLDGEYKWIAHAKDHFTRFSWACPLTMKEAKHVAGFLFNIFVQFGAVITTKFSDIFLLDFCAAPMVMQGYRSAVAQL